MRDFKPPAAVEVMKETKGEAKDIVRHFMTGVGATPEVAGLMSAAMGLSIGLTIASVGVITSYLSAEGQQALQGADLVRAVKGKD